MASGVCAICDAPSFSAFPRSPDGLRYVQCERCGFVWLLNPLSTERDIHAESENAYYLAQQSRAEQERAAMAAWANGVLQYAKVPVRSVADIGCSNGLLLRAFADKGYRVLGLERCPTTANFGLEVLQVPIVLGDLMTFRPRARFDLVWMAHVLEHVQRPVEALTLVKEFWCEAGGLLYVQVPSIDLFLEDPAILPTTELFCEGHVGLFSATTLSDAFLRAGFAECKIVRQNVEVSGNRLSMLDGFAFAPNAADDRSVNQ